MGTVTEDEMPVLVPYLMKVDFLPTISLSPCPSSLPSVPTSQDTNMKEKMESLFLS